MSPPSDAPEITAPDRPYRPRPVLGLTIWAMVAFTVLCILAGVAIADFGPRLFAQASKPAAVPPSAGALAPAPAPAPPQAPAISPTPATAAAPPADVARLDARVASLEGQQARAAQAAAAALAASVVVEASQGTAPFAEEMESLRAISPPSPELQSLARLAQAGAPSRTALATSFPDYAAQAARAARAPGENAGLGDRIVYALSSIVSLRRVGDTAGGGVDGVLALAERQVDDGDIERALRTLDRLPPGARDAIAPWRGRAERRAEIDRNAQALRTRALQALAAQARGGA
jgi:hypothetical protein